MLNDTITAIATAPLNQAISIIRISGKDTYELLNKVFDKDILNQKGHTLITGYIIDHNKNKIDQVVLACYRAPKSFTGEDTIEINCHGGVLITQKILQLLLSTGMRIATRGEFTRRAYLNDKIDLIEAEAINDLIMAENNTILKTAINSLSGKTRVLIDELSSELLTLIANITVNIDYPEYDGVEEKTINNVIPLVEKFLNKIKVIKEHSKITKTIKEGINTVIIGKPNVGKSSLLNVLLNEDKAIVSNEEGTTRDLVEGKINLGDISLNLIDTAGIRHTLNDIEKAGIDKSHKALNEADLIILVLDGSKDLSVEDKQLLEKIKHKNYLIAINKTDLRLKLKLDIKNNFNVVKVSAIMAEIENLILGIKNKIITTEINFDKELLFANTRQLAYLDEIELSISEALKDLKKNISIDLIIVHLQTAWNKILEMQGKKFETDLLDEIFKRFCLGK
ncbi:tRNA uridine-5-carboxymethylaminomethyl(34) synthesis GTPase MnmE [Spiroplasma ixodetis]|uniref:tRNA modification GTPase MnmE n=1 Tax=Spiroplasma ixodetis TaxID=2141 RepID=A0ABM8BRB6_9MOLU|nr:tRNA uridine-5-carboxymethylaminomethyl(34) synthesis GTPase MnmE [Spiroplasma ixodetis]BDT02378.1 tRNA modification GTPase MnmE [Spiroplasma ixodetis]